MITAKALSIMPFKVTDWNEVQPIEHRGIKGISRVKTLDFAKFKVRLIEYSAHYESDHWCEKGHIAYCIEGELSIHLTNGRQYVLNAGMSFEVEDNESSHKVYSESGAKLFVVDGDFLDLKK